MNINNLIYKFIINCLDNVVKIIIKCYQLFNTHQTRNRAIPKVSVKAEKQTDHW